MTQRDQRVRLMSRGKKEKRGGKEKEKKRDTDLDGGVVDINKGTLDVSQGQTWCGG